MYSPYVSLFGGLVYIRKSNKKIFSSRIKSTMNNTGNNISKQNIIWNLQVWLMKNLSKFVIYQIEIQKLMKQNEFYESNIDEMEQEITEAIDGAELSERDKRYTDENIFEISSSNIDYSKLNVCFKYYLSLKFRKC